MPNFVVCPSERPVAATIDEHGAMLAPFLLWLVIVAFLVVHQLARRTEAYWLRRQQWREVREALRIRTQDARPLWVRRHPFLSFLIPYPAFVFGFPFFVLFFACRLTSAKVFYVLFFLLALLSFGCGTWRLAENLY